MTVHINDILKEYNKLHDSSYINTIMLTGVRTYDYTTRTYLAPRDTRFSNNHALILAIILLKRTEVDNLLNGIYSNVLEAFIEYAEKQKFFKNTPTYMRYEHVKKYLDYSLIIGIDKNTTKKSLSMFNKQIVDKLFEVNGIQKRRIMTKSNKQLIIDKLNTFTLAIFKEAFKPQSLALTELKRIIKDTDKHKVSPSFDKAWSNAIFNAIKPSKIAYKYLYDNTINTDAEIFNHIVVVGDKSFNTPVDNYKRYVETEKETITTVTDLSNINNYILTKAAIQAPLNSPIYNYITDSLQGTKKDLLNYITKLTLIADKLDR